MTFIMDSTFPVITQILSEVPGIECELHANLGQDFHYIILEECNNIKFQVPG